MILYFADIISQVIFVISLKFIYEMKLGLAELKFLQVHWKFQLEFEEESPSRLTNITIPELLGIDASSLSLNAKESQNRITSYSTTMAGLNFATF
jgi:hypothetical protein